MAFHAGTAVPLTQALPWSSDDKDSILVTDSIETDGRFMLHTIACEALSRKRNVIWLSCGSATEVQVATALRKVGSESAATYLKHNTVRENPWSHPLAIHCILINLPTVQHDSQQEDYLKGLYQRVKEWCSADANRTTIILDDASNLGNLFGERLVYFFISYLRALPATRLVVRCSNDMDKSFHQEMESADAISQRKSNWVGAGGRNVQEILICPWERTLIEFADWIVDVVPLSSGFSREAHGRLVFTARASIAKQGLAMNYCLHDTIITAIRLRT